MNKSMLRLIPLIWILLLLWDMTACSRAPEETMVRETSAPETVSVPAEQTQPVPETEPPETVPETAKPQPEEFLLTFAGDCTLGSDRRLYTATSSFVQLVGEDYGYPFRNVVDWFESDDFTLVNLEGVLADSGYPVNKTYTFRGPTAFTRILTDNSVEAVNLVNNHTRDYGADGYASTCAALEDAGVPYVAKDGPLLYRTDNGLAIGVYGLSYEMQTPPMEEVVAALREMGAEILILSMHWGSEYSYRAHDPQVKLAHQAIDAGIHIVYGHHPHVLQPIEEYGDGIIYYSLGNFAFGGNHDPRDLDSAIIRQTVIRQPDGSLELGEHTCVPVSISSQPPYNNFQPTPYPEGSEEYARVMRKLDGTYEKASLPLQFPAS